MTTPRPELRYLTAADVESSMPPIDERLELAELTLTALAEPGRADLPAKIGVHPRPDGSFAHAMPAHLRGATPEDDGLGMKWIAGFAGNAAQGLPNLHGIVVVNDPATGVPVGILDGGPITAERTAAVSGVAIRRFAPPVSGRPARVAIVGAGVQARSHLAVVGRLLAGAEVRIVGRNRGPAEALAERAGTVAGIGSATATTRLAAALADADVVITVASFTTPDRRQSVGPDLLAPDALVVAVDYATMISAEIARTAAMFVVDHRDQFLANRDAGQFDGYPDPGAMLGEATLAGSPRPAGRILVTHLGVGLADVVFGSAILRRAAAAGLGTVLPR